MLSWLHGRGVVGGVGDAGLSGSTSSEDGGASGPSCGLRSGCLSDTVDVDDMLVSQNSDKASGWGSKTTALQEKKVWQETEVFMWAQVGIVESFCLLPSRTDIRVSGPEYDEIEMRQRSRRYGRLYGLSPRRLDSGFA